MATYPNSYVPLSNHSVQRINDIIDHLLTPRIMCFRQITIFDEVGTLAPDAVTWKFTYGNWNEAFELKVNKNSKLIASSGYNTVNYSIGSFKLATQTTGDNVNCTYNFDMFPVTVLSGFIYQAVDIINNTAVGPPTSYTIDNMPAYWDGLVADLAYMYCLEKLILCNTLWYGRLIYAISDFITEGAGGDIVSSLESLKTSTTDRINKVLDNPLFKVGQYNSPPTAYYYQAIRGFGRTGAHGGTIGYGKTRGWKPRAYVR